MEFPFDRSAREFDIEKRSGIFLHGIYVGIVKENDDVQKMGRLRVYIPELGGSEEPDSEEGSDSWYTVSYCSPFAGMNQGEKQSYGFWAVPPDKDTRVLVCFASGDPAQGYWIGCLYEQFMNHMVPAIGINKTGTGIDEEGLPPVKEYDKENVQDPWDPDRPVFEPLYNGLTMQGLMQDPERGPATTGARRAGISKSYGLLTPRGNSIHIDDSEENEFIRFRTRSGAQITIHETNGFIYLISKGGQSWIEISDESIDLYSKRSINFTAEENINLNAEQNIMFSSNGGIHAAAKNITEQSETMIEQMAGERIERYSPLIRDNASNASGGGEPEGSEMPMEDCGDTTSVPSGEGSADRYRGGAGFSSDELAGFGDPPARPIPNLDGF